MSDDYPDQESNVPTPEEPAPPTQPAGSLVPPSRRPPTAVGAPADQPSWSQRFRDGWRREPWRARAPLATAVEELLDAIDSFADEVASRLGLR